MFGTPVLLFTFGVLIFLIILAFSKYGNIRLGKHKPHISTPSWVALMLCAGLGSATVYWAFVEWGFYYLNPGLGADPETNAAYEWSLAYNFFHWGMSAWALYCVATLPVAYHYYVRNKKGMSLSSVTGEALGFNPRGVWGTIIDIIFVFGCLGGLSITLGLSLPLLSQMVASVFGIEPNFYINIILVLLIFVTFTVSSYFGIEKGVKRLTDFNVVFVAIFIGLIFLIGPTMFIVNNTANGLGIMFQNFIHMSLWTDPISSGSGFPEEWTIFYWLYWISYTPFMAIFVTRISRGRKIKEVIGNMILSGSAGCWVFFGVLQNFSMHQDIQGTVNVSGIIERTGDGNESIIGVLNTLPASGLFILFFVLISMLFLASTLDSASYTLGAVTTKGLKSGQDPTPAHRLFWCVMIVLVPLSMISIGASFDTINTIAIVTSLPLIFILLIMIYGLIKWMKEDYGNVPSYKIKEESTIRDEKETYDQRRIGNKR